MRMVGWLMFIYATFFTLKHYPEKVVDLFKAKQNKRISFCRVASITRFSVSTHCGSLPALPSSSLATTWSPSGLERRWSKNPNWFREYHESLLMCVFKWNVLTELSQCENEILFDKWCPWSNCGDTKEVSTLNDDNPSQASSSEINMIVPYLIKLSTPISGQFAKVTSHFQITRLWLGWSTQLRLSAMQFSLCSLDRGDFC